MHTLIGVDTKVLLRHHQRDDEAQAESSRRVIEGDERVFITDVVLAETLWTLIGRRYRASKADLVVVVDKLLQKPNIRFEDDEVIWSALQAYRETDADFADALIVFKALKMAVTDDMLNAVYTFDAAALRLPNTTEP